jgi:hypothetical protein
VQEDGTIDVGWNDVHRVLGIIGFTQVPNVTAGILTYQSKWGDNKITIVREDRFNIDYFHEILELIHIPPELFVRLAFS